MEGITAVSIAGNIGKAFGRVFLQNDKCRSFSEIQSCPCGIEWTARLLVEYHQGIEAVQMKLAERFRSACNDNVRIICPEHFATKDDRIECRRASCGNGTSASRADPCKFCHFNRTLATFVSLRKVKQGVIGLHLLEILLSQIHTSDSGAVYQDHSLSCNILYTSMLQSLSYRYCTHEGSPAHRLRIVNSKHGFHLVFRKLYFAYRKVIML